MEPTSEVLVAGSHAPDVAEQTHETSVISVQVGQERLVPPIPSQTRRVNWKRTAVECFPYAPQDEQGVVALFAVLCNGGQIERQILDLNGGRGIDATCYDEAMHREIRVELKHTLSRGSWNHSLQDIDYLVCWENRWPDFPKPVIELKALIKELTPYQANRE